MFLIYLHAVQTSTRVRFKIYRTKCNLHRRDCQWVCWGMKNNLWSHCIIHLVRMISMIKCKIEIISKMMDSKDRRMRRNLNIMMKRKSKRFRQKLTPFNSHRDRNKTDIFISIIYYFLL